MVRDVLVADTPLVQRTDIYAMAALGGAAVVVKRSARSFAWASAHRHSPRLACTGSKGT